MASKTDQLLVEKPGESHVQGGVTGHLARNNNTLSDCNVQLGGFGSDDGWLWNNNEMVGS